MMILVEWKIGLEHIQKRFSFLMVVVKVRVCIGAYESMTCESMTCE